MGKRVDRSLLAVQSLTSSFTHTGPLSRPRPFGPAVVYGIGMNSIRPGGHGSFARPLQTPVSHPQFQICFTLGRNGASTVPRGVSRQARHRPRQRSPRIRAASRRCRNRSAGSGAMRRGDASAPHRRPGQNGHCSGSVLSMARSETGSRHEHVVHLLGGAANGIAAILCRSRVRTMTTDNGTRSRGGGTVSPGLMAVRYA